MPTNERSNRLIHETSPYLLQHAHNPVDWYPWGDEAFARAAEEDKPVLVSIGYSACHWCHVMEHESFEDDAIAAIQNEHFVNIKVDMEERPDIDQIYMTFVQLTSGRGGWPMNVFVTPEKLPFFGGTYFPPTPRHGMPSWPQILHSIADAWRDRREELTASAVDIAGELRRVSLTGPVANAAEKGLSDAAYRSYASSFDRRNGGWGGAPKFPQAMGIEFLLRYWKRTGEANALEMAAFTAEAMARGGIYDQLGGGFHRYAVDAIWLVPHFEKMLYDNAQLARVYLHLHQIFRSSAGEYPNADRRAAMFGRIARETLDYVRREMLHPDGGFFSSQDADSEGVEGKFFVWTLAEVEAVLGSEDAAEFCHAYDVTEEGNFEEKNILNLRESSGRDATPDPGTEARFDEARRRLFEARESRVKPFRDEKILTAWNGLMLAAFAEAANILDDPEYLDVARKNADLLLTQLRDENGTLLRTWKDGKAKLAGYLEDHASLADGLIELYQASGGSRYLSAARELAETMISKFWDDENGGFFFTASDHEELLVRNKDLNDNATPSGNSTATDVLLRLAKFFGDERYERFAMSALRVAAASATRYPQGFARALSALEFAEADVLEVAIIGDGDGSLSRELWREYRPFKVASVAQDKSEADASGIPLLEGRSASADGSGLGYVCRNFTCGRPAAGVDEFRAQLDQ